MEKSENGGKTATGDLRVPKDNCNHFTARKSFSSSFLSFSSQVLMPYARMCDAQIEKPSEVGEWATHLSPAPLVIFLLFPQCSQNPFRAAAFEFSPRDSPQNTERFAVYMISEHPISHKSESVGEKKTTIR